MATRWGCCTLFRWVMGWETTSESKKPLPKPVNFKLDNLKRWIFLVLKAQCRAGKWDRNPFPECVHFFRSIHSISWVHGETSTSRVSVPQPPRPEAKGILFSLPLPELIVCLEVGRAKLAQSDTAAAVELQMPEQELGTPWKGGCSWGKTGPWRTQHYEQIVKESDPRKAKIEKY